MIVCDRVSVMVCVAVCVDEYVFVSEFVCVVGVTRELRVCL